MSFIVNPISYRLSKTKFSKFNWIVLSKNSYKKFFFEDKILDKFYLWFKFFLKWIGFNVAILNYNIIKFYKYFQFNIKIIIREEYKKKFFNKKKKKFFFNKKKFNEIENFSDIKNIFNPSKRKPKTKKEKEEEKKRIFRNKNYLFAEKLFVLEAKKSAYLENKRKKKLKKPLISKSFFKSKFNYKKNRYLKKNIYKFKKFNKKKKFLNLKNKYFKNKKFFILLNKNLKENDIFFKYFIIFKKKNQKNSDLRFFLGYLKKLKKHSLNFYHLKKKERKKIFSRLRNNFYFLERRMNILKKLQKKEFVLQTIFINRLKNKSKNYFLINSNNLNFLNKFYFIQKTYFLDKNFDFLNFFLFYFIKMFLIFFLNNLFLHNKIILNFFNQNEFFNSSESLVNFLRMRISQKYQVSHILNLLFNNLRKKKSIIGIEIGLFGRYQKKLRNRNIWKMKGLIAPSNINSTISYKSFVVLLRYGVCGVKLYLLSKVYKNEIF